MGALPIGGVDAPAHSECMEDPTARARDEMQRLIDRFAAEAEMAAAQARVAEKLAEVLRDALDGDTQPLIDYINLDDGPL